jgi:hypothetical protein
MLNSRVGLSVSWAAEASLTSSWRCGGIKRGGGSGEVDEGAAAREGEERGDGSVSDRPASAALLWAVPWELLPLSLLFLACCVEAVVSRTEPRLSPGDQAAGKGGWVPGTWRRGRRRECEVVQG